MDEELSNMRSDDVWGAFFGGETNGLSEDERAMQRLLVEEYRKQGKVYLDEIRAWREKNPKATMNEAIRALFDKEQQS